MREHLKSNIQKILIKKMLCVFFVKFISNLKEVGVFFHLFDKIEFEDIEKGSEILNDLIEKGEINFIPQGLIIDENLNNTFNIIYQDLEFNEIGVGEAIPFLITLDNLEFNEIGVGEAIPFLITLDSLLKVKPIVTLNQICDELKNFLEKLRSYY